MKVIVSEKQYKILKEALGVPDNILDAAEKFYDIFLRLLQSIRDESDEYDFRGDLPEPIVIGDKKLVSIDDYELEIKVVEVDDFQDRPKIASMGMGQAFTFDTDIMMRKVSESTTADFNMTFIAPTDWTAEELAEEFIRDKEEYISSLAHEIKHKYDKQVKRIGLLGHDADYVAIQKLRGTGVDAIDKEFLFYMYYMQGVESLVRNTEIASRMRTKNITKSQFKEFLMNTQVYQHLRDIRDFTFEKFVSGLKNDIREIEGVLDQMNIDYETMTDKQKVIEYLEVIYYTLSNIRLKKFKGFMEGPMGGFLSFLNSLTGRGQTDDEEERKEKVFNKYKNTIVKYQNNPTEYFKYEIEKMSYLANNVLKKLGKLYSMAKDGE